MSEWRNRIIGSGVQKVSELLANPKNWRIHPKQQQEALKGALNEVGWVQEIIVNQRTGHVVDGHMRVTLAMREGEDTEIPVKYVDLSEEEEALVLATLDPIAAMAATDKEKLDDLMHEIQTGEAGLMEMLEELAEENSIIAPEFPEYDETIADGIEVCTCPHCGNEHAAKKD